MVGAGVAKERRRATVLERDKHSPSLFRGLHVIRTE